MNKDKRLTEAISEKALNFRREEMKAQWDRVLPTNELLWDRWEKAKFLQAGDRSSVYDSSVVMGNVAIGEDVWIGPFTVIEGINGKIEIGNYCHISSGVHIYTHDSVITVLTNGKKQMGTGDVSIGSNTHIGSMSIIMKNVKIGHHCVVGAGSFVNRDIPDYSIAFGTPAKVVGKIVIKDEEVTFMYY